MSKYGNKPGHWTRMCLKLCASKQEEAFAEVLFPRKLCGSSRRETQVANISSPAFPRSSCRKPFLGTKFCRKVVVETLAEAC